MIRKVPNMSAWVLRCKDFSLLRCNTKGVLYTYELPLFSTDPHSEVPFFIDDDELVLVMTSINKRPLTLEQIEEINKIWNKFYE